MRVSTLFRLLAWGFCAYYIYHIAAPTALRLYVLSPNLWKIQCGQTWLSWLSSVPFVAPGHLLENACCVGSHCVAIAKMPNELANYRVPRSLDRAIDYWCDNDYYSYLTLGRPEVCHLTLAGGNWEVDISRAFIPTLHGLAMLFLFSYALRHAMARKSTRTTVVTVQQVQTPMDVLRVRDSKVSEEVAKDLKDLLQDAEQSLKMSHEKITVPSLDADVNNLEAYIEGLPHIDADLAPKRVGPRPRKA